MNAVEVVQEIHAIVHRSEALVVKMQVSATFLSVVLALLATCLELRDPINSFTYWYIASCHAQYGILRVRARSGLRFPQLGEFTLSPLGHET